MQQPHALRWGGGRPRLEPSATRAIDASDVHKHNPARSSAFASRRELNMHCRRIHGVRWPTRCFVLSALCPACNCDRESRPRTIGETVREPLQCCHDARGCYHPLRLSKLPRPMKTTDATDASLRRHVLFLQQAFHVSQRRSSTALSCVLPTLSLLQVRSVVFRRRRACHTTVIC